MTSAPFRLDVLNGEHDRRSFHCGEEALDRYFQTQVTQDIRRNITTCFVVVESSTGDVVAYYTLAAASIPFPELPPEITKRLPHYATLPAVRIGRLAVDQRFQKRGLGAMMLADAARRAMQAPLAVFTLLVDAKNDEAVAFYQRHGFRSLASQPQQLFLPLTTAAKALPGNAH